MDAIDKDWFFQRLEKLGKTVRGLAKQLDIDPSAVSRMFGGTRKMKLSEAENIARFLETTTEEVLSKAGIPLKEGSRFRIMLGSTIGDQGKFVKIDPQALPPGIAARAQAVITSDRKGRVLAAQVRAGKGPLSIWDDALILFEETDLIEPAAVGVLTVATLTDGMQMLGHLEKSRKTGEATIRLADGTLKEVVLSSAAKVLAVLP